MTYVNDDIRARGFSADNPLPPEVAVDLELIDDSVNFDYDPIESTGDAAVHVPGRTIAHTTGGGRLPLAEGSNKYRIEWNMEDGLVAWLPVYVRSVRTTRVRQTRDEHEKYLEWSTARSDLLLAKASSERCVAELERSVAEARLELARLEADLAKPTSGEFP